MTNVTENENEQLTALDVLKWFKVQNRRIKGLILGSLGLILIALAILSSLMLPQSDQAPVYTKTEEIIKTVGVLSLLLGLTLTHLAMYLLGSFKKVKNIES